MIPQSVDCPCEHFDLFILSSFAANLYLSSHFLKSGSPRQTSKQAACLPTFSASLTFEPQAS